MRILLVNDLPPGPGAGAEMHLERLGEGLERRGDVVEVFAGAPRRGHARRALDVWNPDARRALRKVATRFRPDVVHHHNVRRELSVSVLGVPEATPCVLTVHDLDLVGGSGLGPVKRAKARFDRAVARRRVDVAIAVSSAMADRLRRAGFPRVVWIPAAAPQPRVNAARPSALVDVVYAGRLGRGKGVDVLIRAFGAVVDRFPESRLVVVGDGPDRGRLEGLARRWGDGRVLFTGRVPASEVEQVMARARVVAAPSVLPEGAGLTVVEAALLARPVIVTDDPALRELVDEAGCGLVVGRGGAGGLAGALERVLADPALADRLGAAGRAVASETRTIDRAVVATRDVYASIVGTTRALAHG